MKDLSVTEFRRQCLTLFDALPDEESSSRSGDRPARIPKRPMTSYLVDINVWLALTWDSHPQHVSASRWYTSLNRSGDSTLLFCRLTMLGLLRLLTNRAVMGDSTASIAGALGILRRVESGSARRTGAGIRRPRQVVSRSPEARHRPACDKSDRRLLSGGLRLGLGSTHSNSRQGPCPFGESAKSSCDTAKDRLTRYRVTWLSPQE